MSSDFSKEWARSLIEKEGYWFHKIRLGPDLVTPGWSDPEKEKLPYFGLPEDMTGMRVLDIGFSEGFFSFEAERRGAREVVGIDPYPPSTRKFHLCRTFLGSNAAAVACNVYDLSPRTFGTFDLVFFFGVLYHLRHPLLALEKILSVCTGTLLLQTHCLESANPQVANLEPVQKTPTAIFYPFGVASGPRGEQHDPTVFWVPNAACVEAMLLSTGFRDVEQTSPVPGLVYRARSPLQAPGQGPDEMKAPWS